MLDRLITPEDGLDGGIGATEVEHLVRKAALLEG